MFDVCVLLWCGFRGADGFGDVSLFVVNGLDRNSKSLSPQQELHTRARSRLQAGSSFSLTSTGRGMELDRVLTLTNDEFDNGIRILSELFHDVSTRQKDHDYLEKWALNKTYGIHYLGHPPVLQMISQTLNSNIFIEDDGEFTDGSVDAAPDSVSIATIKTLIEWKFSIVYSHIWRVPVLYFQVYASDGCLLTRNEVLSILRKTNEDVRGEDAEWDFLSQDEHPLSGMPSFFLHPCQTSKRLHLILGSSNGGETHDSQTPPSIPCPGRVLLSWLSMILPAAGFRISPNVIHELLHQLEGKQSSGTI